MVHASTQTHVNALFGNTDYADGVPDDRNAVDESDNPNNVQGGFEQLRTLLSPAAGPVYLEGRLVLSLSFQPAGDQCAWLDTAAEHLSPCGSSGSRPSKPLERYRLWDDAANAWFDGSPTVLRFENADVVECGVEPQTPVWIGKVDTRTSAIPVPDLDAEGIEVNLCHDLRWKRC